MQVVSNASCTVSRQEDSSLPSKCSWPFNDDRLNPICLHGPI